jgi:hypothetical protein
MQWRIRIGATFAFAAIVETLPAICSPSCAMAHTRPSEELIDQVHAKWQHALQRVRNVDFDIVWRTFRTATIDGRRHNILVSTKVGHFLVSREGNWVYHLERMQVATDDAIGDVQWLRYHVAGDGDMAWVWSELKNDIPKQANEDSLARDALLPHSFVRDILLGNTDRFLARCEILEIDRDSESLAGEYGSGTVGILCRPRDHQHELSEVSCILHGHLYLPHAITVSRVDKGDSYLDVFELSYIHNKDGFSLDKYFPDRSSAQVTAGDSSSMDHHPVCDANGEHVTRRKLLCRTKRYVWHRLRRCRAF